jgi:hypothetical protein
MPFCIRFVLDEQKWNIYDPGPTMERFMAWFKDAAAGVGLVIILASSFVLTSAAQAFLVG